MTKPAFTAAPDLDRQKKIETFLNTTPDNGKSVSILKKEDTKNIYFRFPESLFYSLQELSNLTGISMNSTCLEILRPIIRAKLKQVKSEMEQ